MRATVTPGDTTTADLAQALLALAATGQRPRCGDPDTHGLWLSDDPTERAQAARWCNGCPVFDPCGTAAEQAAEKFGVWGGVDRTKINTPTSKINEGATA